MIRAGVFAAYILALSSGAAVADTPLLPASDWTQAHPGGVTATATLDPPRTTIAAPGTAPWHLEFWVRPFAIHPAPDGAVVLVSVATGAIIGADWGRDDPVLWVYAAPGEEIAQVPLRSLISRRALPRSTSGYVWIDQYTWSVDGWAFETPDGQRWHLGTDLSLERR